MQPRSHFLSVPGSPMDSLSSSTQRAEGDPQQRPETVSPQTPEGSPTHYAAVVSAVPEAPKISFPTPSAIRLLSIIAANCVCSGAICLCLWGFSTIDNLTRWEKRAFNALSLLLSAALGFGIGFLCDRIGLFARGTLLQSKPHSVEEVYICAPLTDGSFAHLCYVRYSLANVGIIYSD